MVSNFNSLEASTKVLLIGFLKKNNMLNYHIETDGKFSSNLQDFIIAAMNDTTAKRSIR
jgi:hypothetical protein